MKRLSLIILAGLLALSLFSCAEKTLPHTPPTLVAHAGGAVYGYRLTNSKEALNRAYKNGYRHIELDFEISADGEYVLLHDWNSMGKRIFGKEGQKTLSDFKSAPAFMNFTLLDIHDLFLWLRSHPDCYIVTDAKCENLPFLTYISQNAGEFKENFIPQVYSFTEYDNAKALGFEKVILTLYRLELTDEEIISFAKENVPYAITMPEKYISQSLLSSLSSLKVTTYLHTINDLSTYEAYREIGLYGIYTDYFVPDKWEY